MFPLYQSFVKHLGIICAETNIHTPRARRSLGKLQNIVVTSMPQLAQLPQYIANSSFYGRSELAKSPFTKLCMLDYLLQDGDVSNTAKANLHALGIATLKLYHKNLMLPNAGPANNIPAPPRGFEPCRLEKQLERLSLVQEVSDQEPDDASYTRFLCTKFVTAISETDDPAQKVGLALPVALRSLFFSAQEQRHPLGTEGGALDCYSLTLLNDARQAEDFPKTFEEAGNSLFTFLYLSCLPEGDITQQMDMNAVAACKQFMQGVYRDLNFTTTRHALASSIEQLEEGASDYPSSHEEVVNARAIRDLFQQLEGDPQVAPSIVAMLRDDWAAGGSLIGVNIKQNLQILSRERHEAVMSLARELSRNADVYDHLQTLQEVLHEHVLDGKVVLTPQFAREYPRLENLTVEQNMLWEREFQRIVNTLYLKQEIAKPKSVDWLTGLVEKYVLEVMGLGELQVKKEVAEIDALSFLLHAERLEAIPLEALIELIQEKKMEARLRAVGVDEMKTEQLMRIIPLFVAELQEIRAAAAPWRQTVEGMPDNFPPLARRALLCDKSTLVSNVLFRHFKEWLSEHEELWKKKIWNGIDLRVLQLPRSLKIQARDGTLFVGCDKDLEKNIYFFSKWGHRIVQEMRQGFDDIDEIFHSGTCFATTTRWVVNEQRNPTLNSEELAKLLAVGQITPSDRYWQVHHHFKIVEVINGSEERHSVWHPKFLEVEKIKAIKPLFSFKLSVFPAALALKNGMRRCIDRLPLSNGVLCLGISRHLIYMRIDHQRGIFRLGDVNVGLFDFSQSPKPLNELYDCFNDLMYTVYSENTEVTGYQFEFE